MTITVERIEAEVVADPTRAIRDLGRFDRAVEQVTSKRRTARVDVDTRDAVRNVGQARNALGQFTKVTREAGDAARGAAGGAAMLGGALRGAGGGAGIGARGMSRFAASLPMMIAGFVAIASVLPYVISLINTLGGAAFALGGQLSYLAGLAGALPGLFIAAAGGIAALTFGLKGIGGALKAYETAAKEAANSTRSQANLARQRANAERNLERAVKAVTVAQQTLVEAEKDVAEARREAARDLEDARQRVADSILAEEDAIDAVAEAQERLRQAQNKTAKSGIILSRETDDFTGKVYEVARTTADAVDQQEDLADAERGVRQAINAATKATKERKRANEDLAESERKGVEGSDRVVQAHRRVEAAHRGVETALEGVRDAQDSLRRTTAQASQAQKGLKDALDKLTPAGRAFVLFLKDEFIPAWGDVQKAFQNGLLGEDHLTNGLTSIMGLFDTLIDRGRDFGHTVGHGFENFGAGLLEREGQIDRILQSSNTVLASMIEGITQLGYGVLSIADGARDMTEWLADAFSRKMTDFAETMDRWAKDGTLVTFFDKVKAVAQDVWHIFGNIAGAIGNMIGASAPLGTSILDSLVGITDEWERWTGSAAGQARLTQWFNDLREPLSAIWTLLGDIAYEFLNIGGNGKPVVEGFTEAMYDLSDVADDVFSSMEAISQIIGPIASAIERISTAAGWLKEKTGFGVFSGNGTQADKDAAKQDRLEREAKEKERERKDIERDLREARRTKDVAQEKRLIKEREERIADEQAARREVRRHRDAVANGKKQGIDGAKAMQQAFAVVNDPLALANGRKTVEKFNSAYLPGMTAGGKAGADNVSLGINSKDFKPGGDKVSTEVAQGIDRTRPLVMSSIDQMMNAIIANMSLARAANEHTARAGMAVGNGAAGDGPGRGRVAKWANAAIKAGGGRITSTYRTPIHNRRIGGSPNSYHLDEHNPAHDIGGSPSQLAAAFAFLATNYGGQVRELIYGNQIMRKGIMSRYPKNDHWDHVHVAHQGGKVTKQWPTMPGLRGDERPAILQVGETVVPASVSGAGAGMTPQQFEAVLDRVLAKAKPNVQMENTFTEHVDPTLVGSALAWSLR